MKNIVEVGEDVFADLMVAGVHEKDDVDYTKQRQQYDRSFHRFPDNANGQVKAKFYYAIQLASRSQTS